MKLYDTHFHLDLQKNVKAAIDEINANKIYTIAMTNLPILYEKEIKKYSSPYIRLALGFHPELVGEYYKYIPLMWEKLNGARYIGEVGLDLTDTTYKNDQIAFFSELIERCRNDKSKIISIHSRNAEKEVFEILGDTFSFKPILHWYSGEVCLLNQAIEVGCYVSFNTQMLKSNKMKQFLSIVPQDRILLETDSPFGARKETHNKILEEIICVLAQMKEYTIEQMEEILWNNFHALLM